MIDEKKRIFNAMFKRTDKERYWKISKGVTVRSLISLIIHLMELTEEKSIHFILEQRLVDEKTFNEAKKEEESLHAIEELK